MSHLRCRSVHTKAPLPPPEFTSLRAWDGPGPSWKERKCASSSLVGFSSHWFSVRNLTIFQSTGPDADEPISALSLHGNYVWATAGPNVLQYTTGKQVRRLILLPFSSLTTTQIAVLSNPQGTPLSALLNFGNQVLALTEDGHYLHVWNVETGDLDASIVFDDGFTATNVIHPVTMLNKVLVASAEGSMQLWNIRTRYVSLADRRKSLTHIYDVSPYQRPASSV